MDAITLAMAKKYTDESLPCYTKTKQGSITLTFPNPTYTERGTLMDIDVVKISDIAPTYEEILKGWCEDEQGRFSLTEDGMVMDAFDFLGCAGYVIFENVVVLYKDNNIGLTDGIWYVDGGFDFECTMCFPSVTISEVEKLDGRYLPRVKLYTDGTYLYSSSALTTKITRNELKQYDDGGYSIRIVSIIGESEFQFTPFGIAFNADYGALYYCLVMGGSSSLYTAEYTE